MGRQGKKFEGETDEQRQKRLAYQRAYYHAHKEECRGYMAEYRRTHKKKMREYQFHYWRNNGKQTVPQLVRQQYRTALTPSDLQSAPPGRFIELVSDIRDGRRELARWRNKCQE